MGAKEVTKSDDGEKKQKAEGGEKKKDDGGVITVVLKVDMHCDGCAKKVKRSVKGFPGVETVAADVGGGKLTVVGKVDPWKIRERVESKTHKTVVLISPTDPPKKKEEKKKDEKKEDKPAAEEKKPKAVVSTVVMKIRLHCEGCIQRIRRTVSKIKGVEEVTIDSKKDLVTVKGTMDPNSMVKYLQDKFKRNIEVIPAKKEEGGDKKEKEKEKEKGTNDGEKKDKDKGKGKAKEKDSGDKKEKDGGGEKKKDGGGDKKKDGGGEKKDDGVAAPAKVEANKMEYYGGGGYVPYGYQQYPQPYNIQMVHAPQMFSDENPNACTLM